MATSGCIKNRAYDFCVFRLKIGAQIKIVRHKQVRCRLRCELGCWNETNWKKDAFLSNVNNKQKFIYLVGESMSKVGISVVHAKGDADCQIVQEALKSAADCETHIVGEDTDLLVLLLFHVKENMSVFTFPQAGPGQPEFGTSREHNPTLVPMCATISCLPMLSVVATQLRGLLVLENKFLWRKYSKAIICFSALPKRFCKASTMTP